MSCILEFVVCFAWISLLINQSSCSAMSVAVVCGGLATSSVQRGCMAAWVGRFDIQSQHASCCFWEHASQRTQLKTMLCWLPWGWQRPWCQLEWQTVTETKSAATRSLSDDALKMLVQAIVSCRQDYCNALLCGISDGLIQYLQFVLEWCNYSVSQKKSPPEIFWHFFQTFPNGWEFLIQI